MNIRKSFLFAFAVTLGILTATSVLAWTGPSASPPLNNATAPLNVSSTGQIKAGSITATSLGAPTICLGSPAVCNTTWPTSTSQWTTGSGLIYYNGGSVGIGTANPLGKLSVQGDAGSNRASQIYVSGATNANQKLYVGINTTGDYGSLEYLTESAHWGPLALQADGGNVGIGTVSPGAKLTVQGAGTNSYTSATFIVQDNTTPSKGLYEWYDPTNDVSQIQSIQYGTAIKNLVLQGSGGNVGIGTTSPGQTLSVNGKIYSNTDVCTAGGKCLSAMASGGGLTTSNDYIFGGAYSTYTSNGACEVANPLTGGCSCPTGAINTIARWFSTFNTNNSGSPGGQSFFCSN